MQFLLLHKQMSQERLSLLASAIAVSFSSPAVNLTALVDCSYVALVLLSSFLFTFSRWLFCSLRWLEAWEHGCCTRVLGTCVYSCSHAIIITCAYTHESPNQIQVIRRFASADSSDLTQTPNPSPNLSPNPP